MKVNLMEIIYKISKNKAVADHYISRIVRGIGAVGTRTLCKNTCHSDSNDCRNSQVRRKRCKTKAVFILTYLVNDVLWMFKEIFTYWRSNPISRFDMPERTVMRNWLKRVLHEIRRVMKYISFINKKFGAYGI
jgi:hypothetical protein